MEYTKWLNELAEETLAKCDEAEKRNTEIKCAYGVFMKTREAFLALPEREKKIFYLRQPDFRKAMTQYSSVQVRRTRAAT